MDIQEKLLDTNSVPAAMQMLSDNYPEKFLLKGAVIEQNLVKSTSAPTRRRCATTSRPSIWKSWTWPVTKSF